VLTQVDGAGVVQPFGVESPAYVAIRFLQFVGVMLLIGLVVFRATLLPRLARDENIASATMAVLRRQLWGWARGVFVMIATVQVARLAAQHIVYFEYAVPNLESLRALLVDSGWGHAWLLAVAAWAAGWIAVSRIRQDKRFGWPFLGLVALALAWTMSLSGHPAAATRVAEAIDVLHVVGVGGWIGGLWIMAVVAIPTLVRMEGDAGHGLVARAVSAFSPAALCFAAVVGISGVLAAWRNVGTWPALVSSTYGQLLLVKVVLVSAMAGVGAFNWRRVLPRLGESRATVRLQRSSGVELLLAVMVLVVTAVLVATEMPS
jgi:putative copper export protein